MVTREICWNLQQFPGKEGTRAQGQMRPNEGTGSQAHAQLIGQKERHYGPWQKGIQVWKELGLAHWAAAGLSLDRG